MLKENIEDWNNKGFFIGKNIINKELSLKCQKYMFDLYSEGTLSVKDFGSEGKLEFPSNTIIDNIMLDENIIKCVQRLLNTNDILLVQADAWGK